MSKYAILFLNTENLYDTVDDPIVRDGEYTPEGEKHWTVGRYNKKLSDVGDVICRAPGKLPVIIGLAEVENDGVLQDLIAQTDLRYGNYKFIHEHSADMRGIDVALLYDADVFTYESHESIRVKFPWNNAIKSRDILYVKGSLDGETLHLFVNHWPARNKGALETEEKRLQVADYVRKRVDQLFEENEHANIILMGDFNDEPEDKSLQYILRSKIYPEIEYDEFYNLMSIDYQNHRGTNVYERDWLLFDQFHVSSSLLHRQGKYHVSQGRGFIHKSKQVLFQNKHGFKKPDETYSGDRYYGGVSDHLAVYMFLED